MCTLFSCHFSLPFLLLLPIPFVSCHGNTVNTWKKRSLSCKREMLTLLNCLGGQLKCCLMLETSEYNTSEYHSKDYSCWNKIEFIFV